MTDVQIIILTTRRRNGFAYLEQCLPAYRGLSVTILSDGLDEAAIANETSSARRHDQIIGHKKAGAWPVYHWGMALGLRPRNDWTLICEDDVLFGVGLAEALDHIDELDLPPVTSLCPIGTGPRTLLPGVESRFPPLHGAQAILYRQSALRAFYESDTAKNWKLDKGPDLALSEHLRQNNLKYGAVFPSWAQHIGEVSCYPDHGSLEGRQATSVMSPTQWARMRMESL